MEGVFSQSYDADKLSPCNKQGVAACVYMLLHRRAGGEDTYTVSSVRF